MTALRVWELSRKTAERRAPVIKGEAIINDCRLQPPEGRTWWGRGKNDVHAWTLAPGQKYELGESRHF